MHTKFYKEIEKTPLGRPRCIWQGNIKMGLKGD
jgi:hypothetical protein